MSLRQQLRRGAVWALKRACAASPALEDLLEDALTERFNEALRSYMQDRVSGFRGPGGAFVAELGDEDEDGPPCGIPGCMGHKGHLS